MPMMVSLTPRTLLPHQEEMTAATLRVLETNDRCHIISMCGTGKTLGAIAFAMASGARTIVVLTPWLSTLRQLILDWQRDFRPQGTDGWGYIIMCSDGTLGDLAPSGVSLRKNNGDVVTRAASVAQVLAAPGIQVVFTTYSSAPKLKEVDLEFDLGIFDEAHHTSGREDKRSAALLKDSRVKIAKRVFYTATARVVYLAKNETEAATIYSMDDETMYGPRAYYLPFRAAVDQGLVTDFRIVFVDAVGDVDTENYTATMVATKKAMEEHGVTHAMSFHNTVDNARYYDFDDPCVFRPEVQTFLVHGGQPTTERSEIMSRFEQAERGLLSSVRVLAEGVDTPSKVGLAVLGDPRRAIGDLTQMVGRVIRLLRGNTGGKKIAYVLIPVFRKNGQPLNEAIAASRYCDVAATLYSLGVEDGKLTTRVAALLRRSISGSRGTNVEDDGNDDGDGDLPFECPADMLPALIEALSTFWVDKLSAFDERSEHPDYALAQHILLDMAARKMPQPSKKSEHAVEKKLAVLFQSFTSPTSPRYDIDFDTRIRIAASGWVYPKIRSKPISQGTVDAKKIDAASATRLTAGLIEDVASLRGEATQDAFAARAGITRSAVAHLEQGRKERLNLLTQRNIGLIRHPPTAAQLETMLELVRAGQPLDLTKVFGPAVEESNE